MTGRRGRPKLTADAETFRKEVARQLKLAISSRDLKVSTAAAQLGVSRQAFYQYLSARATPHPETIARAMDLWNIEPVYKGERIARGALGVGEPRLEPAPTQLSLVSLFGAPQVCQNENVVVTMRSSHDSTLQVTIRMKKADGPVGDSALKVG